MANIEVARGTCQRAHNAPVRSTPGYIVSGHALAVFRTQRMLSSDVGCASSIAKHRRAPNVPRTKHPGIPLIGKHLERKRPSLRSMVPPFRGTKKTVPPFQNEKDRPSVPPPFQAPGTKKTVPPFHSIHSAPKSNERNRPSVRFHGTSNP